MLHGIADPDIILSSSTIDENQSGGTLVGIVSGAGANAVYELVSGPFTLAGDELRSHTQFDHEAQSSYNIVIRAYPAEGPALERTLQVSIGDVVEAPTIVVTRLSGDVYENQTSQSILLQVGVDPGDAGFGPLALELVGEDAHLFELSEWVGGGSGTHILVATSAWDYEQRQTLSCRWKVSDARGLSSETDLTIPVVNLNDTLAEGDIAVWGQLTSSTGIEFAPSGTGFTTISIDRAAAGAGLALQADGRILAWGWDGVSTVTGAPAGSGFTQVVSNQTGSLALDASGSIHAWGVHDPFGIVAAAPQGPGHRAITANAANAFALRADGSIAVWGVEGGPTANPPAGSNYRQLSVDDWYGLALRDDGSIVAWGSDVWGTVSGVPLGSGFRQVYAGRGFAVALTSSGEIVLWSNDPYLAVIQQAPQEAGFVRLAEGYGIGFAAIRADGTIAAWGGAEAFAPVDSPFLQIVLGPEWNFALRGVASHPKIISLSGAAIAENQPVETVVGVLTTTDVDNTSNFTYTLVGGTGDTDNASFSIGWSTGDRLLTATSFDFETKSSYSIRVRATDAGGLWFENQFNITVTNVNEAPTQIALSNVVTSLLATANTSSAIPLADVSVTDDGLGTNTLSVSGADAGVFELVSNQLRLKAGTVLNHATQKTYSVTVNVDDATVGGTPDASVDYTLNLQGLDATVVQNGSASRSYVRYVTLTFGTSQGLAEAVSSIGTATPRMSLTFAGTTGTQALARSLTGLVSVVGAEVRIDFGVNGVGGNRNSSLGDGVYRLRLDLDGDGTVDVHAKFFRLFGDVDGNGVVNDTDIGLVQTAQGQSGANLATDINGDGLVNLTDLNNVKRRKGAKIVWP